MADFYVRFADGSDTDDGLTWATARQTVSGGLALCSAGDRLFVSQAHAETAASAKTLTSPGTSTNPVYILCVEDSAEPPTTLAITGSITTTGNNALVLGAGYAYVYGITFNATTGNSSADFALNVNQPNRWVLENCKIATHSSNSGSLIIIGNSTTPASAELILINTDVQFGNNVGQSIAMRGDGYLQWRGGSLLQSVTGASVPTSLITNASINGGRVELNGVSLANLGSGKSIFDISSDSSAFFGYVVNCNIGASCTLHVNALTPSSYLILSNTDSADTNYRYQRASVEGNITNENTIVRVNGATDNTTPFSFKAVSNATCSLGAPLRSEPIIFWNDALQTTNVIFEIITDNVTLTDKEIWIEVEYSSSSTTPKTTFVTNRISNILNNASNHTTSTVDWITTGLGTPVKQRLTVSPIISNPGLVRARLVLAKPSTTVYFCPKVLDNATRSFIIGENYINQDKIDTRTNIFNSRIF